MVDFILKFQVQLCIFFQELPNARSCLKYFENSGDTILGYRAVHVNWKDLDFCNVCDMDEVNNPVPVLI
jgi:hypothetical protein